MAELIYSGQALTDLDRLTGFLLEADPASAQETAALIVEAAEVLVNHPFIGRPVEEELRELLISRGQSGYVALYSHEETQDTVLVLAIRHQREAGYPAEPGAEARS
ncbi:MAG TPA: type II toxin-antitoxin system RelE/ParE family toxin [Candidatus Binatia bacterium]|nr:type II toxin-antitoxin system RelE/ParE family toxin [Candidatus Binatia bacterium]